MHILKSSLLIIWLLFMAFAAAAQDDAAPYLAYYEDENPGQLDYMLIYKHNVCLEAILRLNPGLDINNIAYGDRFYLPADEPCYQYADSSNYGWWNFEDGYPPRLKYYEHGQWLEQPYYSDEVVYVRPTTLEGIALKYNICVDDLLAENILLHDFERYKTYAAMSLDVFIPKDAPPCDPNWTPPSLEPPLPANMTPISVSANDVTPTFFAKHFNICPEEVSALQQRDYFYWPHSPDNPVVSLSIPTNAPPCYNEAGQRLRYYDDLGRRLDAPIYSDLAVYIAAPGEDLSTIADRMDVCFIDLLRINRFPDTPLNVEMELLLPPPRPCPEDIEARLIDRKFTDIGAISQEINICPEDFLSLNPHLSGSGESWHLENGIYSSSGLPTWILVPKNAEPCYTPYLPHAGDSIADIERILNVCYQEFWHEQHVNFSTIIPNDRVTLYIRNDAPPCYNEAGQRRHYPSDVPLTPRERIRKRDIEYTSMPIHIFQREDTVYSISQQYNVCVPDLLKANSVLTSAMPTGYPTFIPKTRPCYDQATGMPLIYEDNNGKPLPQPRVGEHLIYYGSQPLGYISSYYNVCANRIEDANRTKKNREISYLGWIIPIDRPPCYDADGLPINYVCYTRPMDFRVDYSRVREPINFDINGTYCYDLAQPETLVWYQNAPYKIVNYENNMFTSRAFTAWCFGVSLAEIDAINDAPEILAILPFHARAIPVPTRDCYLQNPGVLDGHRLHTVENDETLHDIARRYDMPYQWIALANDLDSWNTIWAGQELIIPDAPTFRHAYFFIGGLVILLAGWLYWRRTALQ